MPFISADETGPKHIEEVLHREQFEDLGLCLSLRAVAVFCSAGRALEDLCGDLLESLEKPVRQALQAWSLFWLQCLPRFHEQACSNGVSNHQEDSRIKPKNLHEAVDTALHDLPLPRI